LDVGLPKAGTLVRVDFLQRTVGESGQMEVQNWIEPRDLKTRIHSWRFRLAIPGGGLIEHNDEFPFTAPENGYKSEVILDYPKDMKEGWVDSVKKKYYVAFGQPRKYGRIQIEADGIYGGLRIQYAINPDGGRDLEPKEKPPFVPALRR